MSNECKNIRAVLEELACSDVSSTARLVAILESCGVTDRETLERLTASKPATVRAARQSLKIQRQNSSVARNPAPEIQRSPEIQRQNSSALAHASKESPSEIVIPSEDSNKQTDSQPDVARDDLKTAFNGSTANMIADVRAFMAPYGTDAEARKWLAGSLTAYGKDAMSEAYQAMLTKRSTGEIVTRPLQCWSKIAANIKANPAKAATGAKAATAQAGKFPVYDAWKRRQKSSKTSEVAS